MKKMITLLLLLCTLSYLQISAQKLNSIPRSTPEQEGVSSLAISAFLDSVDNRKHEFHSFMLLRHGKVIAEGWWNPYRADLKHTLYSLSKSFTATAVGFARAEGKLSLSDKVISFFPDLLPDTLSAHWQQLKVKDLLTMSAGQDPDPTMAVVKDSNWVKRFLALPIKYEPGTRFLYNTAATYMLSAIVQKVTGEKIVDYLRPRLFDPLNITGADWETDLNGINTGGWGLRLKTEDLAKFAQLFLQKGVWNGQQVLPAGWAEEASAAHIIQHPEYAKDKRDKSDWEQGYGYQMWRSRNNAYRGDGAFGQYAIVMPEQDAVIAITSESNDMQDELNMIWEMLLPAMQNSKLPVNKSAHAALQLKLASLELPVKKKKSNPVSKNVAGKIYTMEPNPNHVRTMRFDFKDSTCQLQVKTDTSSYSLNFSANDWQKGETSMPGPYLLEGAKNNLIGLAPFKIAGKYTWLDSNTVELVLRYVESPHTRTLICRFEPDTVSINIKSSFSPEAPGAIITLKGANIATYSTN